MTMPVPEPRPTHLVRRGAAETPCWCAAPRDHLIGEEVQHPVVDPSLRRRVEELVVVLVLAAIVGIVLSLILGGAAQLSDTIGVCLQLLAEALQ